MCWNCVNDYMTEEIGVEPTNEQLEQAIAETAQRPHVIAAAQQVRALYVMPGCGAGGPLHVVVDDTNVEDEFLEQYRPEEHGHQPFLPEVVRQADQVLEALRPLTLVERAVATVMTGVEA